MEHNQTAQHRLRVVPVLFAFVNLEAVGKKLALNRVTGFFGYKLVVLLRISAGDKVSFAYIIHHRVVVKSLLNEIHEIYDGNGRFVDKKLVFDNDRINLATRFLVYIGVAQRQRGDGICVYTGFLFDFSSLEAEINSPAEQAQNENRSKNAITVISAFSSMYL